MPNFEQFTLADIRTSVRRKLGDASYDADTIDEAANDFQYELFNDNRIRFMESSEVLNIGSGDTTMDFPKDFMTMLNFIAYDSPTQYRNITRNLKNYDDFMRNNAMFAVANPQQLMDFTFFGEGIRFSAPSNAAYSALLDYLRVPKFMRRDADKCEVPRNYKEMVVLGTLEKVLFVDEELDSADFALERLSGLRTSFIRNYARGSGKVGPQQIRQGRGRGTYRADRDF